MRRLLEPLARLATRHPLWVIAGVALITGILGAASLRLQMEADLTAFIDEDSEAAAALERIGTEFGAGGETVQVIFDAGPGGDVLHGDGLRAVAGVERRVGDALGDRIRVGIDGRPVITSLSGHVAAVLEPFGRTLDTASDAEIAAAVDLLFTREPQLLRLISFERDLEEPRARATLLMIELDPGLDDDAVVTAAREIRDLTVGGTAGGLDVLAFSTALLLDGLQEEIARELPLLLGLAVAVVLAVLVLVLRSVTDVIIGLGGLAVSLVWTFGLIAILGPGVLGLRGPFTQVSIVVPVLLVGLGIDYTVHLTSRYREQRAEGDAGPAAAGRALHTVGAGLVLATLATALGFGASGAAPLQIIADLGIFTAVGVVCAFVATVSLVTSVNAVRGRRRHGRSRPPRTLRLGPAVRLPVAVATRWPAVALLAGAVLISASLLTFAGLETTFDRDDFVPPESDVGRTSAALVELFGGDLAETTYVVVDGDLGAPRLLAAMYAGQQALAGIEAVRTVEGIPQAHSIVDLVVAAIRELTGDPDAGFDALPEGVDDLKPFYGQLRVLAGAGVVDEVLNADASAGVVQIATAGGPGTAAAQLRAEILAAFVPVEQAGGRLTVTSDDLVMAELATELQAFQGRSILIALFAVFVLLSAYYGLVERRFVLGVSALMPAAFSASMLVGAMWVLGMSFNPVTATLTAISIGIGVPYGIHLTNRFTEELARNGDAAAACRASLHGIGGALVGSALTTLGAFVVLSFAGLLPLRQLGMLGALSIAFALLGALFLEPGALYLWARRHRRRALATGHGRVGADR